LWEDELFEKVWPRELAISGISVISVLCMFRCLILQKGDFPAILQTIDQTFFIEVDFGDVCLPGVTFRRFNHTPGLGPDDPVVFNIVLCRVLLHLFKGLVPGFNGCFVAPDGIMFFFGIWFAFWDAIICYVDDNIRKLLNRILCTTDSVSAEFQSCLM